MAFNHLTIGTTASTLVVNNNYLIENVQLTSVGLSVARTAGGLMSLSFRLGLSPPGDQDVQVYSHLLSGLFSPSDGAIWSGRIRITDPVFITLNYISSFPVFILLTWTTGV
jgi:hypothetical protein